MPGFTGYLWTERKSCGFKNIRTSVDGAAASRFFVHFFCRRCTTTTWSLSSSLMEHEDTRQRLSVSSVPEL